MFVYANINNLMLNEITFIDWWMQLDGPISTILTFIGVCVKLKTNMVIVIDEN